MSRRASSKQLRRKARARLRIMAVRTCVCHVLAFRAMHDTVRVCVTRCPTWWTVWLSVSCRLTTVRW